VPSARYGDPAHSSKTTTRYSCAVPQGGRVSDRVTALRSRSVRVKFPHKGPRTMGKSMIPRGSVRKENLTFAKFGEGFCGAFTGRRRRTGASHRDDASDRRKRKATRDWPISIEKGARSHRPKTSACGMTTIRVRVLGAFGLWGGSDHHVGTRPRHWSRARSGEIIGRNFHAFPTSGF